MKSSDQKSALLALRPAIPSIQIIGDTSPMEIFQNHTLRPILKFQNDLFIQLVQQHLKHRKIMLATDDTKRKQQLISQLRNDRQLRYTLQGTVIGLFTSDELEFFQKEEKEIRKRIQQLLEQRLISQLFSKLNPTK